MVFEFFEIKSSIRLAIILPLSRKFLSIHLIERSLRLVPLCIKVLGQVVDVHTFAALLAILHSYQGKRQLALVNFAEECPQGQVAEIVLH